MPDKMNAQQLAAVTAEEGNLLILAGPGSGKTYVLTQRILYLLRERHLSPERILVITFTKDAAVSMQERFRREDKGASPVGFGTFHSVFYTILRSSRTYSAFRFLTDKKKKYMMRHILRQHFAEEIKEKSSSDALVLSALEAIGYYKNSLSGDGLRELLPEPLRERSGELFARYERLRRAEEVLDFDDMVYDCYCLLSEDETERRKWSGRFSHILVDEFQDINPVQYQVLRLLAGDGTRVFAVGDECQGIYGFRGSNISCMKEYLEDFRAQVLKLETNYRSLPDIVEASNRVIREGSERFEKEIRSARSSAAAPCVTLRSFESRGEEYRFLTELLKAVEGPETALLFRTNLAMQSCAAALTREGIGFEMKEQVPSIYRHRTAQDVMDYLTLAEDPSDRSALVRILNRPLRYLRTESLSGEGDPLELIRTYYRRNRHLPYAAQHIEEAEKLGRQLTFLRRQSLHLRVQFIRRSIGLEAFSLEEAGADEKKKEEIRQVLDLLTRESAHYGTLSEWRKAQAEYEKNLQKGSRDRDHSADHRVRLMTVHASKGLEFDTVILPDCNEGQFPYGKALMECALEEERRIFYVAMTRAKNRLLLLYQTGSKERPRFPSRFLKPLLSATG